MLSVLYYAGEEIRAMLALLSVCVSGMFAIRRNLFEEEKKKEGGVRICVFSMCVRIL